jgi:hypothetical protein
LKLQEERRQNYLCQTNKPQVAQRITLERNWLPKKSGVTVELTCTGLTGTGTGSNIAGPPMRGEGVVTVEFKECVVDKPVNCSILEPTVITEAKFVPFHTGAGVQEKGVKISPKGVLLTSITLKGTSCSLAGTYPVEGSAIGRPKGATLYFEPGEDELTFAKEPADLQGVVTDKTRQNAAQAFTPVAVTT